MFSIYVSSNSDYQAFLLEGNGISIHEIRQNTDKQVGTKESYFNAYIWAIQAVSALFKYNKLPNDNLMCYLNNLTTQKWLTSVLDSNSRSSVPRKYFKYLHELATCLNSLPVGYDLSFVEYNRAKQYATEKAYLAQKAENKPIKATDAFKSW